MLKDDRAQRLNLARLRERCLMLLSFTKKRVLILHGYFGVVVL
jgi:hypothetical protein